MSNVKTRFPQTSLAACLLPWTERFELDVERFQTHVQQTIDLGYNDIYLMGTAGEGYALGEKCFRQVVSAFAQKTVRPNLRPQVGVISLSTQQIIDRVGWCREQGIRLFQLSLPSWGVLTDAETLIFFKEVCGTFPDCQFLHYNLPRAKRVLTGKDYRRIADAAPNLVATKNSTTDYSRIADLMRNAPDIQHFFTQGGFAFGCLLGECSLLCSFCMLFPQATRQMFEAGRSKDFTSLWRWHKDFNELVPLLFSSDAAPIDGAYDKVFCWLMDDSFPLRLLPPYLGFSADELSRIRTIYETKLRHWE